MHPAVPLSQRPFTPDLLPLDQVTDAARYGTKAATLALLRQAGCRVPDGFVLAAGAALDRKAIAAGLAQLGSGPWVARSSAIAEDLEDASFAGQYESVLNLTTHDAVLAATQRVITSGSATHLASYQGAASPSPAARVAVLIQQQVAARAAGIAFSANPVTGDPEVVIEATRGLGDQLAAGERDADRWIARSSGMPQPIANSGVIDAGTADRIAELARRVSELRGAPQDLEWAINASGALFLLQARPITRLPQAPQIEIPPGRWMKDNTHWSGPISPVGAAILLPAIESSIGGVLQEFGFPLEAMRLRSFGGEVYTQEIEVGGKHNPGPPPPWWLGAIVFRVIPPLRRLAATARHGLPKLESYPRAWEETWRDECARRIHEARAVQPALLSDDALQQHLRHLIDQVVRPGVDIHFKLMIPDMVAMHELAACCEELLRWNTPQSLSLVAGLSRTATLPATELAHIATVAGENALRAGFDAIRETPAGPRLDAWAGFWGLRVIDCDPGSATISEYPALMLGLLRQQAPDATATEERRQAAIASARAQLDETQRARFDAVLRVAERVHPQREENVLYTQSLPLGLIRRTLLEMGRRLVVAGQLQKPTDIVMLNPAEIAAAFAGSLTGEPAIARVRRRTAEQAWVRAHPGPAYHGPAPVAPPSARGLPAALQRLLQALLWDMSHEETVAPARPKQGTLTGVAASPGRVTGNVRVLRSEAELTSLQSGEILVCPSTHSTWAIVFAKAAAIVTDHGGALSHPSIVAREFGIPAVVGTAHATTTLRTGQTVTVDGTAGRVETVG